MKIKGKFAADLTQVRVKSNLSDDGQSADVDVAIRITEAEGPKAFGDDFTALAFGNMVQFTDEDAGLTTPRHLVDSIKPGKVVVCEKHAINLAGEKVSEQPKIMKIKTEQGQRAVIVFVRIPVPTEQAGLIAELSKKVGKVVDVEFEPAQIELKLTERKRGGGLRSVADEALG